MLIVLTFLVSAILSLGGVMYVFIMGPSPYHRDGMVGRANRILRAIPIIIGGICCSVRYGLDQRQGRKECKACCNHATKERNWLMVGFYIVLVWTVEVLYLFFAVPKLKASLVSKAVSWGLVLLAEYLYCMAVFSDPGAITPRTLLKEQRAFSAESVKAITAGGGGSGSQSKNNGGGKAAAAAFPRGGRRGRGGKNSSKTAAATAASSSFSSPSPSSSSSVVAAPHKFKWTTAEEYVLNRRYCIDGMVYALASDAATSEHSDLERSYRNPTEGTEVGLGQTCSTCIVMRPARSKHCNLCNMCIRRYDHHCPWINRCVGEGTHRYFLGFLIVHGVSCTWACLDLYTIIKQFLIGRRAWGWVLRSGSRVFHLRTIDYVTIVVHYCLLEAALLFFAVCISLVLYCFWAYQMTFVTANLTMNDLNKMEDVALFIAELPTLEILLRETRRVERRLEAVACRKPRQLPLLVDPPAEDRRGDAAWAEGGKKNKAYRARVKKMVLYDLKGLYDRGYWGNIKEVFLPYAILTPENVTAAAKVTDATA